MVREGGSARICTTVTALIDTDILVYRYDGRDRDKQAVATSSLRQAVEDGSACVAHQAIVELVAATTRPIRGGSPLLTQVEAGREAEEMMSIFEVLYLDAEVLRLALRGAAAYQLSWWDAHMWGYAERYGLGERWPEDFEAGRL